LPNSNLSCKVDLDIHLESKGSGRETTSYGSLCSGEGHYQIWPFKRISGNFEQGYRDLHFTDVAIEFAGFTVYTDGLRIKNGKLSLQPIRFHDTAGNVIAVYEHQ
jgi:hypothetical protein